MLVALMAAVATARDFEFTPLQTIPDITQRTIDQDFDDLIEQWIENLYPARSWHYPDPSNWQGLAVGLIVGTGTLGTLWLPVC